MGIRVAVSLCCAALAALVAATPASALIRVQKGIAGVSIGMTQTQMREVLGEPIRTRQGLNDLGPYTQFVFRGRIAVTFQGNRRVTSIYTSGPSERTSDGIGVGSRERSVLRHVPNVQCRSIGRSRSCYVGSFLPGRRVTVFKIVRGRVARVTIGVVID
ncbi:MAG: hypothetical protein IRZ21_11600 [Thermoleophilaceae bacterium]|nr:hypothetical protein [Thermoleophilaceae bacterium]